MAATIYEPLSTAHLKSCTVDFDSRPDKKAVNLVQYDQTIPVLCVSLKKGGTEYKVPSDADVNIRMDKRDGYHVYNPALGVNAERTIAYFAVTPQMSTGWGDYYPIVEITVGGGIAGSAPIWLHFDRNPLPENAIISSDEYKTIQQLLEDVTAVKAATEQIKAQTEAVRDQAKGFADNAKNSADKAQTLVDGMPSDYSQAMKDIGTLKNQMQRAYPDDSTIGENPWSSKHIIDMLCPPLEESDNPVVCYPVAGYPLGVKASWEPMQEGSGTPYPSGGGKNLFNPAWMPEKDIDHGVTWTTTPDGTVTANGTASGTTYYNSDNFSLPAGTYTISAMSHFRISILNRDAGSATIAVQIVGQPHTFTVENDIQNASLFFAASGTLDNVSAKPQIEKGATATAYAPYENIRPIKGRNIVTVNRADGLRSWKMLTLDGTEEWRRINEYCEAPFRDLGIPDSASDITVAKLSQYADRYIIDNPYANTSADKCAWVYSYIAYPFANLRIKHKAEQSTLENWKAYLAAQNAAGTPVQIVYKLKKPAVVPDTNGIFFPERPSQGGSGNPSPDNIRPILLNNAVQAGQTNTLTLPETVYGGEVDAVTGEGNENTKIIMLDGTTNKFRLSGEFWNLQQNSSPGIRDGYDTNCSHFPPGTFGGNQNKGYLFTKQNLMKKYFQDVNAFNAYLAAQYAAGTPVQVCYKLAEPVPFTATGAQLIPALAGVNTVLTDADSATVTGRADPIKRITDLEAAVASIN